MYEYDTLYMKYDINHFGALLLVFFSRSSALRPHSGSASLNMFVIRDEYNSMTFHAKLANM